MKGEMIKHKLQFWEDGFMYEWVIELPYRLSKSDIISSDFIREAKLINSNETTKEWKEYCEWNPLFAVDYIVIDAGGIISVHLMKQPEE